MNQRENHNFHGSTWSYTVPHREERICFACLTETLEDDAVIMVKKRPALAEALHLIHLQNFIDDLQSNIEIAVHFTFVLIGNLKISFKTYFLFLSIKNNSVRSGSGPVYFQEMGSDGMGVHHLLLFNFL